MVALGASVVSKIFANYFDSDFSNPNNFSPVGAPQPGDTVVLIKGSGALAQGTLPVGVSISFSLDVSHGRFASMKLRNATVPTGTSITEFSTNDTYSGVTQSALGFEGQIINDGTLVFAGGTQTVVLPSDATLTNVGSIVADGSSPRFSGGAGTTPFVNTGYIRIINRYGQIGQKVVLGLAIGGTGTITVSQNGALELGAAVGSGQTVQFTGGVGASASVQIDQPSLSMTTIAGLVAGDTLTLANMGATSMNYVANGGGGTLQIYDGGATPSASVQLLGIYAANSFTLTESDSSLKITTNVINTATGSTTAPTSTGVYRFFDTLDGTHFFTANITERDTVLAVRPDLVQESNGFGAQLATSGTTASVYRFFDTVHGTYFYTASASERDQVIATWSDLAYEKSSTFLENAMPQAGDVPVYRLFSTADGTHLYTASAGELSALTTKGGAAYRADLVSEGVSFYASSGSYT